MLNRPCSLILALSITLPCAAQSPSEAEQLVQQARDGLAQSNLSKIVGAQQRLQEIGSTVQRQDAQLQFAEYQNNVRGDRVEALRAYAAVYEYYPVQSEVAALAKIRSARLIPDDQFNVSIAYYNDVLNQYPSLRRDWRDWGRCWIGLYQWQLGDEAAAAATLQTVVSQGETTDPVATARIYLTAIQNPDSTESLFATYTRGIRQGRVDRDGDRAFWDMQRVISKSKASWFQSYLANSAVPQDEKAEALYQVAYARFRCGYVDEAAVVVEQASQYTMNYHTQCLFRHIKAMIFSQRQLWEESAQAWRAMIEGGDSLEPKYQPMIAQCYVSLSKALYYQGDGLGAVMALEEMRIRFPNRVEADLAATLLQEHYLRDPGLKPQLESQTPMLMAKWKSRPRTPLEPERRAVASLTSPMPEGGAE